jgi:HSP20 family protein
MLLTTFDPFLTDFDRMVQRAFGRPDWSAGRSVLPMDVIRRDDQVELRLDLPGADPDSIEVTTDRGVLTVSAARKGYAESDRPVLRERFLGSFTRRVRLADTIDAERIEASYDNGVLSIVLPLAEQAKPRKIEIKGAPAEGELTA